MLMEDNKEMMYIDLSKIDENDQNVKEWKHTAATHLAALSKFSTHEGRKKYMEDNSIWSGFKWILKKTFGEKCWYSECSLEGSFIDVDHFRPKNKSTDDINRVILRDGYWWLAYDYSNYRLSCEKCNRNYNGSGKSDHFPLKSGTSPASYPDKKDENVLLDPCNKDDCELIDSDESGAIIALSADPYLRLRVETSVTIYNLNLFNSSRRKIRNKCKMLLERFQRDYEKADEKHMEDSLEDIRDLVDPRTPYSSFARKYIRLNIKEKPYEPLFLELLLL